MPLNPTSLISKYLVVASDVQAGDWCSKVPACKGNLGVPRAQMPQIRPHTVPDFFAWVKKVYGANTQAKLWKASDLRATQREISENRIKSLMTTGLAYLRKNPMIASKDGYILDGHHRWATMVTTHPDSTVKTWTVGLPIQKLLEAARKFPGTEQAGLGFNPNESKKTAAVSKLTEDLKTVRRARQSRGIPSCRSNRG